MMKSEIFYIIRARGVSLKKTGPHSPAEISPVVFGENLSEKIVIDTESPKYSCNRYAAVAPQTPAPMTAMRVFVFITHKFCNYILTKIDVSE